jgi:hypothetical protein
MLYEMAMPQATAKQHFLQGVSRVATSSTSEHSAAHALRRVHLVFFRSQTTTSTSQIEKKAGCSVLKFVKELDNKKQFGVLQLNFFRLVLLLRLQV